MRIGMIGLGRMGANMVRRLIAAGHECVVHDADAANVAALAAEGAIVAASLADMAARLAPPRVVWLMLPAAVTGRVAAELAPLLAPGDVIVDGGNSDYREAVDRAAALARQGIRHLDVGTSGGVWGRARGYCLMVGGEEGAVRLLDPVLAALAPGEDAAESAARDAAAGGPRAGTAHLGYLHCGPAGAGHFVKMVHNGIEYGLMAAYAEGMNILRAAGAGRHPRAADAETTPLDQPQYYSFDFDLAAVAEVWRHGSVIGSWLLDLTAAALKEDPELAAFGGRVADSGEGRWTLRAAIDTGVPAPVLATALFARFSSRGEAQYADRLLSAMRLAFGGHVEKAGG